MRNRISRTLFSTVATLSAFGLTGCDPAPTPVANSTRQPDIAPILDNGIAEASPIAGTLPSTGPQPYEFARYSMATQALLVFAKTDPGLIADDEFVRYWATLDGCAAKEEFDNEFERDKALTEYREAFKSYLSEIPSTMKAVIGAELGEYDRSRGGFPLKHPITTSRMNFTAAAPPPTNVGEVFGHCGYSPFKSRAQIYMLIDGSPPITFLPVPEATARDFVVRHPGSRSFRIDFTMEAIGSRREPNSFFGHAAPSDMLAIEGRITSAIAVDNNGTDDIVLGSIAL